MNYARVIDYVFYNAGEIEDAVLEARASKYIPQIRNGSGLTDSTAQMALRNILPVKSVKIGGQVIQEPEKWLEVVKKTYEWCKAQGTTTYDLVKMKYGRSSYLEICAKLGITKAQYYDILRDVRVRAALLAAYRQILFVG